MTGRDILRHADDGELFRDAATGTNVGPDGWLGGHDDNQAIEVTAEHGLIRLGREGENTQGRLYVFWQLTDLGRTVRTAHEMDEKYAGVTG